MSEFKFVVIVILCSIGYFCLGFLVGHARGHKHAMDAWRKSIGRGHSLGKENYQPVGIVSRHASRTTE